MAQTMLRDYLQRTEDAISAGHIDEAMSRCQHLLAYFPDALEVQRLLGEVYMAQGHLEDAQQVFDWILTNDPENVIVYCDRALMSERISDLETALDCYQQAYELSRANPQIRQEFNQLSARSGQPGFMFSRAGLARLYMRGDLLVQAIQEWEAVLASTPSRLDARTGLLETYWREGLYDQVEFLASRILEDIPGCVKAMLLLAHVTAPQNFERSKTLVQQARLLDPEMNMASNLFSDLVANHSRDPFLMLLRQEPVVLMESSNGVSAPLAAPQSGNGVEANGSISPVPASDSHSSWHNMESWSELDTLSVPQQDALASEGASSFAMWSENTVQNADAWAPMNATPMNAAPPNRIDKETWQEPQAFDEDFDPTILEQQPWYQAEQGQYSMPPEAASTWDNLSPIQQVEPAATNAWQPNVAENDLPTPPVWLDMLTKNERAQVSGSTPAAPLPPAEKEAQEEYTFTVQQKPEPDKISQAPWESQYSTTSTKQTEEPIFFSSDDKDDDIGWPEWLKSLGAAALEESSSEEAAPAIPEPRAMATPEESWSAALKPEHQHVPDEPAAAIDQTLSEEEKQYMLTLENLEHDLRNQGFVPLEPGMLSTIAQEPDEPETSLSSALAQLANFSPPNATSTAAIYSSDEEAARPFEIAESASDPAVVYNQWQPAESQWMTAVPETVHEPLADAMISPAPLQEQPVLQSTYPVETPQQPQQSQSPQQPQPSRPAAETESDSSPMPGAVQEQEILFMPTLTVEASPKQVFAPAASSNTPSVEENVLTPVYRADSLLEDDLETTMKRPAIRLQPMQKPGVRAEAPHSTIKTRSGERGTGGGSKAPEGDLSNKERLLKGYHYQLTGSYDEAMQEYRIIIRNAPELLGEVISNVRALLKLAPKFSVGYRVLGDAYMRQGEYLQAMEAYNKALTMAKKAKGQNS